MNKIFRFFYTCLAVCGIAAAVSSCSDDNDPTYLGEVKVSQSIIAFTPAGGSVSIDLEATADWTIETSSKDGMPAWVTISQLEGAAGTHQITFTATATEDSREANIYIACAGKKQLLTLQQVTAAGEPEILTVSQAIALMRENQSLEKTVYVKGIVCKIDEISPSYGNATFYISEDGSFKGKFNADGTGDANWFEAYRVKWLNNANFTKGNEFSIGDEIVVTGVITSYKGTPETKEKTGYVYSHTPSLIKVDSLSSSEPLPIEGGNIAAVLSCKGNGISVDIPAEAQSWLSVVGIDTKKGIVTFKAAPNTGGDRSTEIVFKTTDNKGKEYSAQAVINQLGAILEVPVKDFLAAAVGDTQYRMTGVISKVAKAEYGNIYIKDYTGEAYVYGIGAKGDFEKLGLKEGDIVTLVGKRAAYKDSPQMSGGQYESHISVTDISIADFLAAADSKDVYYRVSGTIDEIANDTYGNLYINDGAGNRLYVYGCYPGYGAKGDARKGFLGTAGIKVGDKLTMIGYKDTYNGTIELCGGIYFSHEAAE